MLLELGLVEQRYHDDAAKRLFESHHSVLEKLDLDGTNDGLADLHDSLRRGNGQLNPARLLVEGDPRAG